MNLFDKSLIGKNLPDKLYLTTSNGEFELSLLDSVSKKPSIVIAPPQIHITYYHFTPEKTNDVLSDAEPDYLSIDLQYKEKDGEGNFYFDITYGDAMMFSFEVGENNFLKVGHYNGFGSKFDPNYEFYFEEKSIQDLLQFINSLDNNIKITRDKLNFLDGNKNSFKMEKVNYRRIVDFKRFNPLSLL